MCLHNTLISDCSYWKNGVKIREQKADWICKNCGEYLNGGMFDNPRPTGTFAPVEYYQTEWLQEQERGRK